MLSLLSLIIASGTVLRADTELWEPLTYPDPRTNATECNVPHDGTLCDPDHILTDTWRQTILDNLSQHMAKLEDAKIPYTEEASAECHSNETQPVQIFIILAKRIHTASNQSITSNDLTQFGHGIREAFGLDSMPCKNYILVLGVELAKQIYLWTGSDLAIPKEQLDNSLAQYKNLFTERNHMEGLNKIVDEITSHLLDPFKVNSTTAIPEETTEDMSKTTLETSTSSDSSATVIPGWMYAVIVICVCTTSGMILFFIYFFVKHFKTTSKSVQIFPADNSTKPNSINMQKSDAHENFQIIGLNRRSSIDSESSHQPRSEHSECSGDNTSIASHQSDKSNFNRNSIEDVLRSSTKVTLNDRRLSTDRVIARRNSDMRHAPPTIDDQFSSL